MKYVFIINGRAKGKNKELMSRIVSWARTHDSTIHFTKYEKHATYIAKEYASDQNEPVHIFACGGDGLLHEVVNGIAGAAHVTLSVYPSEREMILSNRFRSTKERISWICRGTRSR